MLACFVVVVVLFYNGIYSCYCFLSILSQKLIIGEKNKEIRSRRERERKKHLNLKLRQKIFKW